VSLAHDLATVPGPDCPFPAQHHMLASGDARDGTGIPGYEASRDYVGTDVHGFALTHVDALCHMFVRGRMYNGRPADLVKSTGAQCNSVMALAGGVTGRGVLLDVPRARGVPFLAADDLITVATLEAAERREGVRVGEGDLLLVSTGRAARTGAAGERVNPFAGLAGLHPECLPWLHERGVALLGGDGISDPMPALPIDRWPFPVHQLGLVAMGLHLIDNLRLDELSEACAARERWTFLLTVAPLRIPGGTGCPVNPIALL
jgi:kynurenine formamidase